MGDTLAETVSVADMHSAIAASNALPPAHSGAATRGTHASSEGDDTLLGAHHDVAADTSTADRAVNAPTDASNAVPGSRTTSADRSPHVAGPEDTHEKDAASHVPLSHTGRDTNRGDGVTEGVKALVVLSVAVRAAL